MTMDSISKSDFPNYKEKIYEFNEEDIKTIMRDFLFSNSNLNCLIMIRFNKIPIHLT